MSNEQLARQWAESRQQFDNRSERERAAAEYILANTTPRTMADVEWDHGSHFMAGASMSDGSEHVMIVNRHNGINTLPANGNGFYWNSKDSLTPNGKRYRLVEVTALGHPETLTTVEDYENAPGGTVVSGGGKSIWAKTAFNDWITLRTVHARLDRHMADTERQVLRWGWGE